MITHQPYPSNAPDAEWQSVVPHLCLLPEKAGQRVHHLRDVVDAGHWLVRSGAPPQYLPPDFPPWQIVHRQTRRRLLRGGIHDLRAVLRFAAGRDPEPTAVIFGCSPPPRAAGGPATTGRAEEGLEGARRDGHPRKLLAPHVTPADVQDRARVAALAEAVQEATGDSVELAHVDRGYTGADAEIAAADAGIDLGVVKLADAKRGVVLLPRRWVVERSLAWRLSSAAWRRTMSGSPRRSNGCITSPSAF